MDKYTGVKLTIAQYMTPNNRKIQAVGIKPDVALEEVDQVVFEKNLKEDRYLREKDLKNHLTATIETEDEKKEREKRERRERAKRIKEMKEKKKAPSKKDDEIFKSYNPKEDYQVLQAVRYLQGFNVFKSVMKTRKK